MMSSCKYYPLTLLFLLVLAGCSPSNEDLQPSEPLFNYLYGVEPFNDNRLLNMVVEIPAGTNQKWEVNKESGALEWEKAADSLRVIRYLPYPANYGMIPGTRVSADDGGDGDPLDVFLLGPAIERGAIHPARLIGMINILDNGEQDDKLIAVDPESWFGFIETMEELEESFPGVIPILVTWLESYKGGQVVEVQRIQGKDAANEALLKAIDHFQSEEPAFR